MRQKFRLFVQKHDNGTYTVTLPGLGHVSLAEAWDDTLPAAGTFSAHGLLLEEVKEDLAAALRKWLARADPATLGRFGNHREGQLLEKVEVELRPADRHGQKRRDRLRITFSVMLTHQESGQYLVTVPKLQPPLAFYCFALEELREVAAREIDAYFRGEPLEAILQYEHQRQEFLDELEVSYNPLKPQNERKQSSAEEESHFWALRAAGVNLSARAREGKLQRAYRRDREVNDLLAALSAEHGACVVLVGPSGAGKTAIVHEAVRRLAEESCPPALRKRQVWYTSGGQLIAGCPFIGEWQAKLQNVVDEVKKRRHILYVEDLADLLDAGRTAKGDDNVAQFLRPFLADGTVVMIGELTPERCRVLEARDPGFLSLFRTLPVGATDEESTLAILGSAGAALEHRLKLRIEPGAAETAVELTRRFQPYRAFPGKAVQFLERAASDAARSAGESRPTLTRQLAAAAFARYTGLPEFLLSDHLTMDPEGVRRHFAERLIGQPEAVETVVDLVTVIKAGLNDPHKPLGCLFFAGPTGVGKTEMVKVLAEYLFGSRDRILRFDMSEYAEAHTIPKLIGGPYGSAEGELTRGIRTQPFSVILLDEFEKAHPSLFDLMLQVLGEGRVTDAAGRTADFRSAIVIMTSNLGASPREQRRPGLQAGDAAPRLAEHYRTRVEAYFRPEFVNRLDAIVAFRALDRDAMRCIASRELAALLGREGVRRRHLLVEIDDGAVDLLLETGFSPEYGARPLKREIERRIIVPLARHLVSHRAGEHQLIQVRCEDGEVRLVTTTLSAAKLRSPEGAPTGEAARLDLGALVEGFAAQRLRLQEWAGHATVREIQNEWKRLLARTRRRGFVNHGPKAHQLWTRIYHLERLSRRLDQLLDRAGYLEEFATLSRRERYRDYQSELAEGYAELVRDVDFLEIELLSAHLPDNGGALLRLQSLGRATAAGGAESWLLGMARMYLQWAQRKGYGAQAFVPIAQYRRWIEARGLDLRAHVREYDPGPPPRPPWVEVNAAPGELPARLREIDPSSLALALRGPNVYGFTAGEAGTHKLIARDADSDGAGPVQTVAARVDCLPDDVSPLEFLVAEWERGVQEEAARAPGERRPADGAPEVIRVYAPEGDRCVRDLRTGVRTNLVREVLDGHLDEFVLAYLKAQDPENIWADD